MNFLKKPLVIVLGVLVLGGVLSAAYFSKHRAPQHQYITVMRGDLTQEVSVTGHVKPADNVDLAFEKSGRVTSVRVDVGEHVGVGETLVLLDSSDLRAQLEEAQAKLDVLAAGTRPEQIQIDQTKVTNAQKDLVDAKTNLDAVTAQGNTTLQNLYNAVPNILHTAYVYDDDAINKQIDPLFTNDTTANPLLSFITSDSQAQSDSQWGRYQSGLELAAFSKELANLGSDPVSLDSELSTAAGHLTVTQNFLPRLSAALDSASGLDATTLSNYKGYVNTARTNVNTALTSISSQQQAIANQKAANQTAIQTAQGKVNDAQNALTLAQNTLALDQAGSRPEDIKAAQANVDNIRAQIDKTILVSPLNGIVTVQNAKVGQIASVGTSVVSVISDAKFQIEADVAEADIAKVQVGQEANVTLDAYGDTQFKAKVIKIDPAETMIEGVATYKTTLEFESGDSRIKSGMTANIDIVTAKKTGVLELPQRAVIRKEGGDQVVLVDNGKGGTMEKKVETGIVGANGNVEITSGLSEGDKVVSFGAGQ